MSKTYRRDSESGSRRKPENRSKYGKRWERKFSEKHNSNTEYKERDN